jgi:penicillin-binding protein 2
MEREEFEHRLTVIFTVIAVLLATLAIRLWQVQLVQGDYFLHLSEENRVRITPIAAPRGLILDQRGRVVVANRPAFTVAVFPPEMRDRPHEIPELARLLRMSPAEVDEKLSAIRDRPFSPVRLLRDAPKEIVAAVEESRLDLPGVTVQVEPVRDYIHGTLAAHLLGYLGEINDRELRVFAARGYEPGDLIGKDGVERIYDRYLRGQNGEIQAEVDAQGRPLRTLGIVSAAPGNTVVLGLDLDVQRAAEEALGGRPGVVIAMDVHTGTIVALASHPAFDPNIFAAGIKAPAWNHLLGDPLKPLVDRAIQGEYPPGSVFKVVTASAALELGLVTPNTWFNSPGFYMLGTWVFHEWKALGHVNFIDAIAQSCDACFYDLGRRLGPDHLAEFAHMYGLGEATGIDLPQESVGVVPDPVWKERALKQVWFPGDTLNTAIGQGYVLATPLQVARMVAAVANGGVLVTPHVVTEVRSLGGRVLLHVDPPGGGSVRLSPQTWAVLRTGLAAVVSRGTASSIQIPGLSIAGKTGTAENIHGKPFAWFAGFAPADAPSLVVVALVENAGFGAEFAAPIAQQVFEAAFGIHPAAVAQP